MKNTILLLLFILIFSQCNKGNSVREQAKAEAVKIANTEASQSPKTQAGATMESNRFQTKPTVGDILYLAIGNEEVSASKEVCLGVTANGFNDLIGLQFTVKWDYEKLEYTSIKNIELVDLTEQNFGVSHADKGLLALSWIQMSLKGLTLDANSHLFDICFTAKAKSGTKVAVNFESFPTPYEVINKQEQILQFKGTNGLVKIK